MDFFNFLTMIGGLSLFLFGMNIMGQALERRAGEKFRSMLGKFTTGKLVGLLTGIGVTAIIQSSSAVTVMVVGFVNSGLMTLKQAINLIMGANIGTTVTAWILSLSGIDSGNFFVKILKPSSFTPILALIGIILYMFNSGEKKKDTGIILLGFSVLMFGMETMSGAVSGLRDEPFFQTMFIMFKNPVLGVLAGAFLTAIIQSSSASVGILQTLASTGQVSYGAAIPIIMGQNIGTCVTAMLSSVGTNKNAKRAAMVHLLFNTIGTVVWLTVFILIKNFLYPVFLDRAASLFGIAVAHSAFNVLCTVLMFPLSDFLEKLVNKIVPNSEEPEIYVKLDERLLASPQIALELCRETAVDMAQIAAKSLKDGLSLLNEYSPEVAASIRKKEYKTDNYEDILGTYLVKLSAKQINKADSAEAARLLKIIGDFERIADHAVNLVESAEEMHKKELKFTKNAMLEINTLSSAVAEIIDLSITAFINNDLEIASTVEPLEQIIDRLRYKIRTRHISRLQNSECSIDAGFVLSDLLIDLERTSDHCSNIAACVMDVYDDNMNLHEFSRELKNGNDNFDKKFNDFAAKYAI